MQFYWKNNAIKQKVIQMQIVLNLYLLLMTFFSIFNFTDERCGRISI